MFVLRRCDAPCNPRVVSDFVLCSLANLGVEDERDIDWKLMQERIPVERKGGNVDPYTLRAAWKLLRQHHIAPDQRDFYSFRGNRVITLTLLEESILEKLTLIENKIGRRIKKRAKKRARRREKAGDISEE